MCVMIYGANGYVGRLLAAAVRAGTNVVAAGRSTAVDHIGFDIATVRGDTHGIDLSDAAPGLQTPISGYGSDFVLDLPGVSREDHEHL